MNVSDARASESEWPRDGLDLLPPPFVVVVAVTAGKQACAGCAVRGRDVANLPSMVKDYVVKRVVMWELGTRDKDEEERRQVKSGRCDGRTEQD